MSPPENPKTPRAYSYVRFSTPAQALGDSLGRQMEKAAKYAADHGLTLDTDLNLSDLGVSAYRQSNAKKGALGDFLKAVADGYVARGSYLLIENMDRLTRDEIVGATGLFLQLIGDGIVVVTLTNNEVFSQDRFLREPWAMHLIVAELTRANQESARKSQLVGDASGRRLTTPSSPSTLRRTDATQGGPGALKTLTDSHRSLTARLVFTCHLFTVNHQVASARRVRIRTFAC